MVEQKAIKIVTIFAAHMEIKAIMRIQIVCRSNCVFSNICDARESLLLHLHNLPLVSRKPKQSQSVFVLLFYHPLFIQHEQSY